MISKTIGYNVVFPIFRHTQTMDFEGGYSGDSSGDMRHVSCWCLEKTLGAVSSSHDLLFAIATSCRVLTCLKSSDLETHEAYGGKKHEGSW